MESRRKRTRNIILAVVVIAVAAGLAALPMLLGTSRTESGEAASILSVQARRGDVRTTISGGGTLAEEEGVGVSVLKGVEVTEYLVSNGDWVEEGAPLARVDTLSVIQTIATVQQNLDYLANQLRRNPGSVGTDAIYTPASGRVMAIYARVGDRAADVMAEHGSLAVVSLDGLMAVEIPAGTGARAGDPVTVTLSDGAQVPGRVERRRSDGMIVVLSDEGRTIGETVRVSTAEGEELGAGELYVHSAWNVTAISGEITYVAVKEGQSVGQRAHLFNLKDVDYSAKFRELSEQHREYEEAMNKLFALYENGFVTAPASGRVSGLDSARVGLMRAQGQGYGLVLLADEEEPREPNPNTDPPGSFTNRAAMVDNVTFGSVSFVVGKNPSSVSAWTSSPSVNFGAAESVTRTSFSDVIVFDWDGSRWAPASPSIFAAGDLVWFVYSGDSLLWILRPTPPAAVIPSFGGGGGGGSSTPFEMFEIRETELLKIIPQNLMTVEVVIDELDILAVAPGQEAEITVDALPGRAYTGNVLRVNPEGKNEGGNTKYTVTIGIERDENMLLGMNATAILTVGVTEDVLTLPAAALNQRGSHSFVYTGFDQESGELTDPVEVELGVSDGQTVEILSGLEEGETVWYSYYESEALPELFAGMSAESI